MKYFGVGVSLVVLAAIVTGIIFAGSPMEARARRIDEERVRDLQTLQWNLVDYWQVHEELPENLEALKKDSRNYTIPNDPTGGSYTYEKTGDDSFKLCATFSTTNIDQYPEYPYPHRDAPFVGGESWEHPEGYHCFEREINVEYYEGLENPRNVAPKFID